ncbi:MAG: PEP-CTERM sorting domain-containing protein [Lentisphaeria bacterium]|jgi:autotransporter-associated beta strand protein
MKTRTQSSWQKFNLALPATLLLAVGAAAPSAQAATYYWDTITTGTWETGANWSNNATSGGTTGTVPLSTDLAVFNQSSVNGAETVNLTQDESIAGITFNNTGTTLLESDSATARALTVSGGITMAAGAGAVTVGDATNTMNVVLGAGQTWTNNSTTNALTVVNGITMNASAQFTLTGAGNFSFGNLANGTGTLTLNNQSTGTVTLSGNNTYTGVTYINPGNGGGTLQSGAVEVTGTSTGSSWNVGFAKNENATLTIQSGGSVSSVGAFIIGQGASSDTGTVNVNGGSLDAGTGTVYVGYNSGAAGNLTVQSSGTLTASKLYIGNGSVGTAGTATVTGAGSTANVGTTYVAYTAASTTGRLIVQNGGSVTSTNGIYLGFTGGAGNATLNIGNGGTSGTVDAGATGVVGATTGATSSVVFNHTDNNYTFSPKLSGNLSVTQDGGGSTILTNANTSYTGATTVTAGILEIASAGRINGTSGITINGGELKYNSATALSQPITFTSGKLSGTGAINTPVSVGTGATLSPGNSIGTQAYTSGLTISGGTLDIELGRDGTTPVSDLADVTGAVTLSTDPNLKLTLYSGLNNPVVGDIFYLISNDDTDTISGEFTKLDGTATTLSEGSLFAWNSQQWKITYAADYGTGFTGGNDLAITVVPEPAMLALLGLGSLALLRRRKKE